MGNQRREATPKIGRENGERPTGPLARAIEIIGEDALPVQTSTLAPAARGTVSSVADAPTFTLPNAAQILGAVWRALDLQFPKRSAQRGRKLLRGDRPGSDETRTGVLRGIARAFVDAGYVHVVDGEYEGVRHSDRAVEEVARSLAHTIAHWDHFEGREYETAEQLFACVSRAIDEDKPKAERPTKSRSRNSDALRASRRA